jgi:hypothetical protein
MRVSLCIKKVYETARMCECIRFLLYIHTQHYNSSRCVQMSIYPTWNSCRNSVSWKSIFFSLVWLHFRLCVFIYFSTYTTSTTQTHTFLSSLSQQKDFCMKIIRLMLKEVHSHNVSYSTHSLCRIHLAHDVRRRSFCEWMNG